MLIKLTNRCYEMCSHCMEDSCPSGEHMSWDILRNVVSFIKFNNIMVLIISGGEVTTDDEFYEKITYICKKCPDTAISIQSNGSFISDELKCKKVRSLLDGYNNIRLLQVSTHKKYYPNYEYIMSKQTDLENLHSKVKFVADWQGSVTHIQNLGRARNLKDEKFKGMPSCSSLLSRAHQIEALMGKVPELGEFLNYFSLTGHFCTPMVNEYGFMYVGECQFCTKIGDISNFSKSNKLEASRELMSKLINTPICNKCGELVNIVKKYKGKLTAEALDYLMKTGKIKSNSN